MRALVNSHCAFARARAVETEPHARRHHARPRGSRATRAACAAGRRSDDRQFVAQLAVALRARPCLSNTTKSMPGMCPSSLCSSLPMIQVSARRATRPATCARRQARGRHRRARRAAARRGRLGRRGEERWRHRVRCATVGSGGGDREQSAPMNASSRRRGTARCSRPSRAARCYTMPRCVGPAGTRALRRPSTGAARRARGGARAGAARSRSCATPASGAGSCGTTGAAVLVARLLDDALPVARVRRTRAFREWRLLRHAASARACPVPRRSRRAIVATGCSTRRT